MKYLVMGETIDTGRKVSPDEFAHVLDRGIVLTLEAYNKLGFKNKIVPNGNGGTRTGVAIVDGDSHEDVHRILDNFPAWFKVDWTVRPLRRN